MPVCLVLMRMNYAQVKAVLFAIVIAANTATAAMTKTTLRIGNSNIGVEVFDEPNGKKHPAILVLHGAGGTLLDGSEMRRVSASLAADGNTVYLVRYFDRTGTLFARDATMQKNFSLWQQTVRDSIVAIQTARHDPKPVGLYGYSLGAFLSLAAASDNPRVAAVVEHAGGIWNGKTDRIGRMPPVLMIHGRRDARVPFEKYAAPLKPLLRQRGASVETRFFPEEGHGFSATAMVEVRQEAVRFFRRHLDR